MIFQGGSGPYILPLDPRMRMIDPLAISKFSNPEDRFSLAQFILQVMTQNMTRCMILRYFIWFYIEFTGILNGMSMR